MKRLLFLASLGCLTFCLGCGGNSEKGLNEGKERPIIHKPASPKVEPPK